MSKVRGLYRSTGSYVVNATTEVDLRIGAFTRSYQRLQQTLWS
jgi:hypothetical protein